MIVLLTLRFARSWWRVVGRSGKGVVLLVTGKGRKRRIDVRVVSSPFASSTYVCRRRRKAACPLRLARLTTANGQAFFSAEFACLAATGWETNVRPTRL